MISKYYKIITYKWFAIKIFGNKFTKYFKKDFKIKSSHSINNWLLIIDEAHNITGNSYGKIIDHVINSSRNTRIILVTATPMKNSASDIIELMNFIRPKNNKLDEKTFFKKKKKVFELELEEKSLELLRKKLYGYIWYYRGWNPLLFAKQNDIGIMPNDLLFTTIFQCKMEKYQLNIYNN